MLQLLIHLKVLRFVLYYTFTALSLSVLKRKSYARDNMNALCLASAAPPWPLQRQGMKKGV